MRSLYARIFLTFWAVMVLIAAGSVGLTWLALAERVDEQPRVSGELMRAAAQALAEGGEPGLVAWLRNGQTRYPELRVLVVDGSGRELLARPLPPGLARLLREPSGGLSRYPGLEVIPARPLPLLVAPGGGRYGILIRPRRWPPGPLGTSLEERLTVFLLALAVTGIASWLLARSITRPVRALSAATRVLAGGNREARVEGAVSARRDELGTLARDFDAMAGRLRELLAGREQLLRDVSHELRSPLARMRLAVGLARQTGTDLGRELDRLETEIERLDRLIGHVLHLSRLDATARGALAEQFDLVDVLDYIARDAAFEAQGRGVRVDWTPPAQPLQVIGNSSWLASAVENVVRNALRYTATATEVSLRVEQNAAETRIVVRDHGPGLPQAELERIFEPFYRVAQSRTRDSGGDGIGLAITARVLDAHGGGASAANAADGGLVVTLWLPREPRAAG